MAVIIAYVLVLQALTGGYARASTISPAENPFHAICASTGIVDNASEKNDNPLRKSVECPCAMLCRLANSAMPAILPGIAVVVRSAVLADGPEPHQADIAVLSPQRRLLAEPRAPPAKS
ncbi:hypothetical protein ACRQ1B_14260 [Rhizobium panacihumi]|uniref:hypothetical protein n=1 Tax=Rhizobium panacihumi TaxID=2008450 RepID=UPI003D7A5ED7